MRAGPVSNVPPAVTLVSEFIAFKVTFPAASTDKYLVVAAAAAVAEVRPNVRLLVEPVAPKTLTPVLNVLIPKNAWAEVFTRPLAVAEALGKFQVAVLPTVKIEKSVPVVEVL